MMAMAIVAIFLSGIHLANSQVLSNVRASLESIAATRDLSSRAEQLRASTWTQVLDSNYLQSSVLNVAPNTGGELGDLVETVDVTAYLAPAGTINPIRVQRTSQGTVKVLNNGSTAMANQTSVRIDVTASWTGKGNRARSRQISLFVAKGGILGRS
jgi:hypothetical protein